MLSSLDSITYRNRMRRLDPEEWAHEVMGGCDRCRTRSEIAEWERILADPDYNKECFFKPGELHIRYGKTTL